MTKMMRRATDGQRPDWYGVKITFISALGIWVTILGIFWGCRELFEIFE